MIKEFTVDNKSNVESLLQAAVNGLQQGDVLDCKGIPYFGIKGINVNQSNLTIKNFNYTLNTGDSRFNSNIRVMSPPAPIHEYRFTGTIKQGWLQISKINLPQFLMLGVDPLDPNEEHFGILIDANQTEVWVPYDINGTNHKLIRLKHIVENVILENVNIGKTDSINNVNVAIDRARNVRVKGVTGIASIAVQVTDSTDIAISGVDVETVRKFSAGGRVFGGWQSRRIMIEDLKVRHPQCRGIFLESWMEDVVIDYLEGTFPTPGLAWGKNFPLIFMAGANRVRINHVKLNDKSQISLFSSGGVPQLPPSIGVLEINKDADLSWMNHPNHGKYWEKYEPF